MLSFVHCRATMQTRTYELRLETTNGSGVYEKIIDMLEKEAIHTAAFKLVLQISALVAAGARGQARDYHGGVPSHGQWQPWVA